MWWSKPTTVGKILEIPQEYSFEFEVKHNVPSLLPDTFAAEFKWDLFYNGKHVSEGVDTFWMNEKRIEQKIFLLGHKMAKKHNKKITGSDSFPYVEGGVHELPHVMFIDPDLLPSSER